MGAESRAFPRVSAKLEIDYEFVDWKEHQLSAFKHPLQTTSDDISVSGIGFDNLTGVNGLLLKQLEIGKKKVKLGIRLFKNDVPLMTFARLVWSGAESVEKKRFGFLFIDVTQFFFDGIRRFIQNELGKQKPPKK